MNPAQFNREIKRDIRLLRKRAKMAIVATAREARAIIRRRAPKAFGHLRDSIFYVNAPGDIRTVVTAPHAQAVEVGSRPHLVPLELLVKWVKLRGMQGVNGRIRGRRDGTSTARQAYRVAKGIAKLGDGNSTPVNAPEIIAKQIQRAIAKNGTKPHWFVKNSLSEITARLDTKIQRAFKLYIQRRRR